MKGVKVHHQSDAPGVMIDFTMKGERYIVISDDVTNCGAPSIWRYCSKRCRCGACRAKWSGYQRGLRARTAMKKRKHHA